MSTVASVSNLSVRFGALTAVKNVSFTLAAGSCLALVGESGSGKSVTARALLGLSGGRVDAEELTVVGQDARNLTDRQWRRLRGARVSMILQDALMALDPLRPIHREIEDLLKEHTKLNRAQRHERVIQALTGAGMDEPAYRAQQRSPQLSGGMRQRALIAQALLGDPDMVIADEATTALDTRLTALVLDQLNGVKHQGRAVLMISHDLAQVAQVADTIAVMRQGEIVETGPAAHLLEDPQHEYTQMLLRAIPTGVPRHQPLSITTTPRTAPTKPAPSSEFPLVVKQLSKTFQGRTAVQDVSFRIAAGQTLGMVGESGSGKTTTARMVLGLERPDRGEVQLQENTFVPHRESQRRALRSAIGAVYQNPMGSFDPRHTVGEVLTDAVTRGASRRRASARGRIAELVNQVHMAETTLQRKPWELSGGQRQRLAIARALATNPQVLILDEPVSALDVSVQATVLDLLDEIQMEHNTSYLLISHDLSVIEHMSDRVLVMYQGAAVEQGPVGDIFTAPQHLYTQQLLAAQSTLRGPFSA